MFSKLQKVLSNEFFQGGILITASSMTSNFLNYFFNFFAARSLGPQTYSEITALFSYMLIISVPASVFTTFLIQKISLAGKQRFQMTQSLEFLFWKKIKRWLFIFIIPLLFIPLIPYITNLSAVTSSVLLPFIYLSFISSFYAAAFQGLRLFLVFAALGVFATFLKFLGALFTMLGVDGIYIIIFFLSLASVLPFVWSFHIIHSLVRKKVKSPPPVIEKRLVALFHNRQFRIILVTTLALTILNNLDIIVVKKFLPSFDAGIYSSWSLLAKIIFYLVGPFISISFVFFSSQENKDYKTLNLSLIILFLIGVSSFVFYKTFAYLVITTLFGEKFIAVSPYLAKASVFGSLYAGIAFINGYFVAKKSQLALILPLFIPIYIVLLLLIHESISQVISLNIIFSAVVLVFYLLTYFRSILYTNSKTTNRSFT